MTIRKTSASSFFHFFFIGRKIKRRKKNLIGGKMKSIEIHFFGFIYGEL
jgi:hypothetical protein